MVETFKFKNIKTGKIIVVHRETIQEAIKVINKKYPKDIFEIELNLSAEEERQLLHETSKK